MAHRKLDGIMGLVDEAFAGRLSRRQILKRGAALGLAAPVAGAIASQARPRRAFAQGGTLNFASYNSDPEPREYTEQTLVPGFEAASGIDVELNTVNHEDFKQAIRTYLASDNPPDVLTWFAGNRMRFFSDKGLLMPLNDLYQEQGWEEAYSEGILASAKGNDGTYYFVPNSYYWWAIYYRPSIFQQAGIEAPPATWDEFLTAIDKLKEIDVTPITIGTQQAWPAAGWFDYLNMRVNGPEFHIQLMDGKAAYNSPEVKETFRHWRELLDREAFIEAPEAYLWQDAVTPLYNGEAAMYLMGQFILDSYPDDGEEDIDFFQFPKINDVPIGEDAPTDGYFAAAQAANVEEATAFLAYAGGAESQQALAESLGRLVVHKDVPLDVYPAGPTEKGIQLLQSANLIAQFYDRDTHPDMAESGMAGFIEFWNDPDGIDAILDNLQAEAERVFAADV
jgi:multiple sugar transport system substrate-binding protein/raffinose/stachyose/melibiose transport system substrate-binding protein